MNREHYIEAIRNHPKFSEVISRFDAENASDVRITYSANLIWVDPDAIDFNGTTTSGNDEELVRAFFLLCLVNMDGFDSRKHRIELEHSYPSAGRPKKNLKGNRADVIVREKGGRARLFVELKRPSEYRQTKLINSQLFLGCVYEKVPPKYLVWATVDDLKKELVVRCKVIEHDIWQDYAIWSKLGERASSCLPSFSESYTHRQYAKISEPKNGLMPLDHSCDDDFFTALVSDLHNVLWGGGGTSSNEVFAILTKLLLCKVYDEKEAHEGDLYQFQIAMSEKNLEESPKSIVSKMNRLYKIAAKQYLGFAPDAKAFDTERIDAHKIAYAVRKLEGISITRNDYDGDLLGKFFEEIVAHGFTQTRGQFFTPSKLVDFMLDLAEVTSQAKDIIRNNPDGLGVRRFPYVIDPSCGVGTFLNLYMKKIVSELFVDEFRNELTERELEAFESGFAGRTHTSWAKSSLYGVESNTDLGLAAKVGMILHGDGSMNTFVKSGLLSFDQYQIRNRPQNVLAMCDAGDPTQNLQFDLVLSNPPFSIKLTDDDKGEIAEAFTGELKNSEVLFIERWSQLLRAGGLFCCVLPESILDTASEFKTRIWLLNHFKVKAIVSLPYSAFKPYTSVKTCVVLAEKRNPEDTRSLESKIAEEGRNSCEALSKIYSDLGFIDEPIFMAEPKRIGYKRRKGLPDLDCPTDLPEVARRFNEGYDEDHPELGFFTTLKDVFARDGARLDPKYRWLWDIEHGEVHISNIGDSDKPLSSWFEPVKLEKIAKGTLSSVTKLVDLEAVAGRTGYFDDKNIPEVNGIGSAKVIFKGCDLLISKLEPYLGKVVIEPPQDAIGTTEWIGLKCKPHNAARQLGYFLMLPEMLDAFRRLQSGKRHARFNIAEALELKVDVDPLQLEKKQIEECEAKISAAKAEVEEVRGYLDALYRDTH